MNARKLFISLFAATAMTAAPLAMADMGRTESTIVGAAVGGVAGNLIGGDMQSTLIGAAAGGVLGNLIAKSNSNYTREGRYNNRYYYGGREFKNRQDYNAYREAARRGMLRDQEARRYQAYQNYRSQKVNVRGNSRYGQQQWRNGNGHNKYRVVQHRERGYGHRR
ncbi:glycine zipper 2TM domain-containing protein [Uruburuella testudinis]|uniref:Glycine zipper 2TM domain-containing protein n=1 Tax=Uruburuella testudinis TaxID=1282863 RepID=A0ABY4DTP5_9NEIS|nr:glycine zipper 2TM domain-containing protein [Uruburuella testudinis]UOO82405.1 glycine zipper 2TM domain-containing protein [Uruburuella testudinis]